MKKLIDIHTHLIPNVDDGSSSIDESILIINKMIRDGIKEVILTSHVQSTATKATPEQQRLNFEILKSKVLELNLDIKLHQGFEVRYHQHLKPNYRELTLTDSKYILLEFSTISQTPISDIIHNIKTLNLIPVIAHVERYQYVELEDIIEFKGLGALIQVNSGSILDPYTKREKKLINSLLKHKLVDIVASDTHNSTNRKNTLKDAYDYLHKKVDDEYLNLMFYVNPKKIIDNE